MAFQVSNTSRKQSTKCPDNFTCSNDDNWDTCAIKADIQGVLLAIKTKSKKINCPYYSSYGNGYFCYCPARCEIYKRHKI